MSINAPLLEAVYCGNYRVCEALLDAGMSQHADDDDVPSALHVAAHRGYVDIMRLLIARGASLNHCNPEHGYYCWSRDGPNLRLHGTPLSFVEFFLDKGTDVNAFSPAYSHPFIIPSRTALQTASIKGDMILMKSLIQREANVNAPASERRGATALQYAVMHGFIGAVKLLIDEGADVNAPGATFDRRTALEAAGEHGRIDTIQLLLLAGAETTGRGQLQYLRAVRFAEEEGHHAAAQLLRGHRAWTEEDHAICREIVLFKYEFEDSDGCSDFSDENLDCGTEADSETEIGSRSNHDSNMEISDDWGGLHEYNAQEL
ncbi:ankyrin repeat-containing domain protein [Thelonectria olida]|uniref:Ankyrin repeat-containing domain protein n=1 Tax=Thelonectria olida TaxID=1576542 RepID=A0A9P8VSN5_9HYPO|nr:ankyrin repeat-containing domain protein [Thelonectria olida]